jgi:hypothetical protein
MAAVEDWHTSSVDQRLQIAELRTARLTIFAHAKQHANSG